MKQTRKNFSFYFLQCFKLYRIISKTNKTQSKIQLIKLFLKWLKLKNNDQDFKTNFEVDKLNYLLKYFNFLLRLLIKYEIVQSNWLQNKSEFHNKSNNYKWLKQFLTINLIDYLPSNKISHEQSLNLCFIYDKFIRNSQTFAQIQFNSQLFLITKEPQNWLIEMSNFLFLKQKVKETSSKIKYYKRFN